MSWFRRIEKGVASDVRRDMPDGLWRKCDKCGEIVYERVIKRNYWTCIKCGYHFMVSSLEYIAMIADENTFVEIDPGLRSCDPLGFRDSKRYADRLRIAIKKTGLNEAVVTGTCRIGEHKAVIGVLDFRFMGGSMASVVGEKISRAARRAIDDRSVLVMVSSSGGARMQEGILSLMQMAKTSAWLGRVSEAGLLYVSVLTNPTTGGVTASFGMLGDVIIAEPGALVGFAGPRVIEQTINQELPPGFQSSEFLLEHGMVDMVVARAQMKKTLVGIFDFFSAVERPVEEKQRPAILKTPPHIEVKADIEGED
ncbi:MAG: acetyl-CoA carboxylase, carboxyltransferase subunit beta [Candidatus Eisenbacteria bacterium]